MSKKGKSENVQVILRVRPLNRKEGEAGMKECVAVDLGGAAVYVNGAGVDGRAWAFDAVYTNAFAQKDVYLQSIHAVVETVLQGYNATIFAYGQSGTGKTYSMVGNLDNPAQHGIIPHALNHIFSAINDMRSDKLEFQVQASFVELYNGKCRDLLVDGKTNLELKENAQKLFYVKDLSMHEIRDTMCAMRLMEDGITRREVKATELNSDSSRSHSLFTVYVKTWDREQDLRTEAKLNLVDLAGSERQSKTNASGDTLKEGNNINLSLTALGTVIDCLVKGKPHIPYRSSPLTMLLKDGLGGNSRTIIVGTIGPADSNSSETVSTLRFIDRAKQIKNKPRVQMDPKDARIQELLEEIRKLRRQLGLAEDGDDNGDDESEGTVGPGSSAAAAAAAAAAGAAGGAAPSMGEKRRSRITLVDDQIQALQRRVEELEVALEAASGASAGVDDAAATFAAKEKALRDAFAAREQELLGQISDLTDRQELLDSDNVDNAEKFEELLSLCTDFLTQVDREKQWVSTVKPVKRKKRRHEAAAAAVAPFLSAAGSLSVDAAAAAGAHSSPERPGDEAATMLVPTVDDIARGFRMVQANGVDMRVQVIRRMSFTNAPHPPPATSGDGSPQFLREGTAGSATSGPPVTPSGVDDDTTDAEGPSTAATPATAAASAAASPAPGGGEKKKKKDKAAAGEKKEKKDKKAGKKKRQGLQERALLAALPAERITEHLMRAGLDADSPAIRDTVAELLALQRTELLSAFVARAAEIADLRDAADLLEDRQQAAELLVAYGQLQEEAEVLHAQLTKAKTALAKSKAVAEKKIGEVTQLKEHIDALRDELGNKAATHAAELEAAQAKMVAQYNKKMEALVAKQSKAVSKDRRERERIDQRVDELTARLSQLEQDYDTKILEYENLLRDYEALKLENLRRFRDQQQAAAALSGTGTPVPGFNSTGGSGAGGEDLAKMRRVVQATMVLDKLTGKPAVVRSEEMRSNPNTAPELPTLSRGHVFQRANPF